MLTWVGTVTYVVTYSRGSESYLIAHDKRENGTGSPSTSLLGNESTSLT